MARPPGKNYLLSKYDHLLINNILSHRVHQRMKKIKVSDIKDIYKVQNILPTNAIIAIDFFCDHILLTINYLEEHYINVETTKFFQYT